MNITTSRAVLSDVSLSLSGVGKDIDNTSTSEHNNMHLPSGDLISDDAARIILWVTYVLDECIALFGTVANIINIICFLKLDLKDAINVSFLALAISDLGSVMMLLWTCVCMIPAVGEADLPFDSMGVQSLVTGWPHVAFTRITSWITALITLERCLCITMPLKIRSMMTSKRVTIIIVFIFIVIFGAVSPFYYTSRLVWVFSVERNRTILKLVYTEDSLVIEQISHGMTNILIPFSAYAVVIISTVTLVVKLRQKTKWRLKSARTANADTMAERDQKVAKMVAMISALFIACFIPLCSLFLGMIFEPKLTFGGQYENTFYVLGGIGMLLEGTNSASNIVIYYSMSSKYRVVFRQLFKLESSDSSSSK